MTRYSDQHLEALAAEDWVLGPLADFGTLPDLRAERAIFLGLSAVAAIVLGTVSLLYCYLASAAALNLDLGGLDRMATVQRFYEAPPRELDTAQPILAIGDSITAGGIDCTLIDDLAGPAGHVAFNLSTSSKKPCEFLLDLEQPLLQRSTVITLVNPATFAIQDIALPDRKANLIRLLDYSLDRDAFTDYAEAAPDTCSSYLFAPQYVHVFDSRWRILTNLETDLRLLLPWVSARSKRLINYHRQVYSNELKWAGMPETTLNDRTLSNLSRRLEAGRAAHDGMAFLDPGITASFEHIQARLEAAAERVILVIAPVHPALAAAAGNEQIDLCRGFLLGHASTKTLTVDCTGLVDEAGFSDYLHLNRDGARAVTRFVVESASLDQ